MLKLKGTFAPQRRSGNDHEPDDIATLNLNSTQCDSADRRTVFVDPFFRGIGRSPLSRSHQEYLLSQEEDWA